jgi:hypothetical protein
MNNQPSDLQASSALLNYVAALQNKDIESFEPLIGHHTLVEIPFMRPNRLVGQPEISKAHSDIFETLDSIDFVLGTPLEKDHFAIAEGELRVLRKSGEEYIHQIGIVAQTDGETLTRISLYADARDIRMWSDRTIL